MGRVRHSWREACASALAESDPGKVPGRIEYAINAMEGRYVEGASDPGTPAELKGIQKAIFALERLMKEALGRYGAVPPGATGGVQTRHIPTWRRTSVKSDASSLFSGLDRCSEIGFR